jgi:hypothetical protein
MYVKTYCIPLIFFKRLLSIFLWLHVLGWWSVLATSLVVKFAWSNYTIDEKSEKCTAACWTCQSLPNDLVLHKRFVQQVEMVGMWIILLENIFSITCKCWNFRTVGGYFAPKNWVDCSRPWLQTPRPWPWDCDPDYITITGTLMKFTND